MKKELNAFMKFISDFEELERESRGVDGLHRNGDVANWDELLPGGRYDDWLGSLLPAKEALGAVALLARVEVVCLCGSTRFKEAFAAENERLTLEGKIVLSVGSFSRSTPEEAARGIFAGCSAAQKAALDELHKRKIDLADRVLVLNVGGYIGSSTRSEIDYAVAHGKPVDYLEPVGEVAKS